MGLVLLIILAVLSIWLLGAVALVYSLSHPRRKTFAVALGRGDPTEPADLELDATAVTFTFTDKTRTPGWIIEGRASGLDGTEPRQLRSLRLEGEKTYGGGVTIVMLHGFGDSRYGMLKRSPLWLEYARKVVVFDLPGQGESESPRGFGGLREPDDVLAVLDQLEPDDAKRILLVGVSMGAGIAIAAAAKAEGELRHNIVGIIAEGPYRYWDEPLHNMFRWRRYPRYPIIPLAGWWLSLTARGFKDFDRAGYAGKLSCPLLVIHGSEDRLCPLASARQIAEAAADGSFVEIEDGEHHDLPFEHEPAYRAAIADFLPKLCPSAGSGKITCSAGQGSPAGQAGPAR